MSNTPYYLSSCAPYSETAAANPMRAYSKEDCAEIIAHEGGTAYVLAEDHERELAVATRERDEARALNAQWAEKAAAWFASPEAAQRFQGYRDLAQQVATAQNERDEARAEVERLRSVLLGHVPHVYEGNCPDRVDPTQRDSYCPACRILAATEPKP